MCALAAGIADAHTLHVGNKSFALSQTKYTTPSLAFGIGNEVWYAPLAHVFINDSLHLRIGSTTYSVINCAEGFVDTENYTYDENGRLIGADEDLYLQSTGTQWIDTDIIADSGTRTEFDYKFNTYNSTTQRNQVQVGCGPSSNTGRYVFGIVNHVWALALGTSINTNVRADLNRHIFILDAPQKIVSIDGIQFNGSYSSFRCDYPIGIFHRNYYMPNAAYTDWPHAANSYSTKIYQNNILIRHFVPVPACMRIGDFVVPENGMWDIVEQKFYGKSGTGSFIYGKDE